MNTHAFAHLMQLAPAHWSILRWLGANQHAPYKANDLVRHAKADKSDLGWLNDHTDLIAAQDADRQPIYDLQDPDGSSTWMVSFATVYIFLTNNGRAAAKIIETVYPVLDHIAARPGTTIGKARAATDVTFDVLVELSWHGFIEARRPDEARRGKNQVIHLDRHQLTAAYASHVKDLVLSLTQKGRDLHEIWS